MSKLQRAKIERPPGTLGYCGMVSELGEMSHRGIQLTADTWKGPLASGREELSHIANRSRSHELDSFGQVKVHDKAKMCANANEIAVLIASTHSQRCRRVDV